MGLQLVLPVLPMGWQFSEVRDRSQARERDGDGVLPGGQSAQRWSGVGRSVNALSQASLACEPSLLQLLVEPIVCRGSCKREQGLGEQARSGWQGPWRFPQAVLSGTSAGSALEGRGLQESLRVGPAPCVLRRDQALLERPQKSQPLDLVEVGLAGS